VVNVVSIAGPSGRTGPGSPGRLPAPRRWAGGAHGARRCGVEDCVRHRGRSFPRDV